MLPYSFAPATTIKSSEVNENLRLLSHSGLVSMWASDTIPDGWLLCDGSSLLRATYPDLFAAIGTQFGAVDGSHFNVPNLKGKVVVGKDGAQTEFDVLGETGGEKAHTLTTSEMPSHYHSIDPPGTYTGGISANHTHSGTLTSKNADGASGTRVREGDNSGASGGISYTTGYVSSDHAHWLDIGAFNSASEGGGGSHNNLQPYIVLNFIIKL